RSLLDRTLSRILVSCQRDLEAGKQRAPGAHAAGGPIPLRRGSAVTRVRGEDVAVHGQGAPVGGGVHPVAAHVRAGAVGTARVVPAAAPQDAAWRGVARGVPELRAAGTEEQLGPQPGGEAAGRGAVLAGRGSAVGRLPRGVEGVAGPAGRLAGDRLAERDGAAAVLRAEAGRELAGDGGEGAGVGDRGG